MPGDATSAITQVLRAGMGGIPGDLTRIGFRLVNELKLDLSTHGRGRIYTTYFYQRNGKLYAWPARDIPHQASAPGDAPAVDTGVLRASYGSEVVGQTLTIGSGKFYAKWLEFGTSKIKPRPHLRPLMARNLNSIRDDLATGIAGRERAMARALGGRG